MAQEWIRSIVWMLERMDAERIREAAEAVWRIWVRGGKKKGGR